MDNHHESCRRSRQDKMADVLSCLDRVVITGILPDIGGTGTMAYYPGAPGFG